MTLSVPGVDYSIVATSSAAEELRRGGYKFAMRYVSGYSKDLTLREKEELWLAGVDTGLVFEREGTEPLQGAAEGRANAEFADQRARALGLHGIPIYFTADFDPTGHTAAIAEYLEGAARTIGHARVGLYGGYGAIAYMSAHKVCRWFWQAAGWADGHGAHPATHIWQHGINARAGGLDVDLNLATDRGAFGVMGPHARAPAPLRPARPAQHYAGSHGHQHGVAPPWGGAVLRRGSEGHDVRLWQERLRGRGFVAVGDDGVFDPQAEDCCRWLQLYLRLAPTGEVDEHLWRATWAAP
jgi:hypothetical protein